MREPTIGHNLRDRLLLLAAMALTLMALAAATARAQESSTPEVTIFAPGSVSVPDGSLFRGAFTPNGTSFYFFRKVTEGEEDYRIYRTTLEPEGWGAPVRIRLGAGEHSDLYPTISPDGLRLVFSSYRPFPGDSSTKPNANLWMARWTGERWGDPVPLPDLSTTQNYDAGPWFDTDGNLHWVSVSPDWRSRSHRRAVAPDYDGWEADTMLAPWADWRDDVRLWGGIPSPDGQLMVLDVSSLDGRRPGPSDVWISRRGDSGWGDPVRLGEPVNTADAFENFVVFSPDGRYLHFVRGFTTYFRVPVADLPGE